MERIVIQGLVDKVSFFGKLIKEEINNDIGAIFREYELQDGNVQEVITGDKIDLFISMKKI